MCNCLETITKKIEEFPEEFIREKGLEIDSVNFQGKFIWPKEMLYAQVKLEYTFEKTNGTRSKPKTKFINIIHSYCAFCGEKLDKEKEVEKEPSMDHLDEQHHFLDNPNE